MKLKKMTGLSSTVWLVLLTAGLCAQAGAPAPSAPSGQADQPTFRVQVDLVTTDVIPRDEKGKFKSYESAGEAYNDTVEVMRKLTPTHVVFNGKAGALTGKNALLLHSLVGGGAVLAVDGVWRASIASGSTDVTPAPDWLASHAGFDFTV